jgi:hypothetical protein
MDDKQFVANQISVLDKFIENNNLVISELMPQFADNYNMILQVVFSVYNYLNTFC